MCVTSSPPPPCWRTFSAAVTSGLSRGKLVFQKNKNKKSQKRCVSGFVCPARALFRGWEVGGVGGGRPAELFSIFSGAARLHQQKQLWKLHAKKKKKWLKNGGLIGTLLPFQSIKMA